MKTKKWLKIVGLILLGFFLGIIMQPTSQPEIKTVEVTKEVPTTITVTKDSDDYGKTKNNLSVCQQMLELAGQTTGIAGDIFGNLDYYLARPSAIEAKTAEIQNINKKLTVLRSQIQ